MPILLCSLPVVSLLVMVLLTQVPWGMGESLRFVAPMLPVAVVHYWSHTSRHLMPVPAVFTAGLAVDVLSHGPLGYWSFVYVATSMLAAVADRAEASGPVIPGFVAFAAVVGAIVALAWGMASLIFLRASEMVPLLAAGGVTLALYPVVACVLGPVSRAIRGPRILNLDRRG